MHQAIWTKRDSEWPICGIPETFYTDHGSDFTSEHLEQIAADLRINLIFSKVGVPRGRGMAEFDVVLIGDFKIDFYDIRHIKIHDFLKWSAVETLEDPFIDVEFSELTEEESKTIDAFINDYYSDGDLYENI